MKNWSTQIRFFYATTFVMLTSMVWAIASNVIFNVKLSFNLFIITLISSLISRYLLIKRRKVSTCIMIPIIILIIYKIIKGITLVGCLDVIFVVFVIIKLLNEETENISYDRYRRIFIRGAYGLSSVLIAYALTLRASSDIIYRGVIIYLVLIIVTLRESMWYCNNIKKNKISKLINGMLIGFSVLITQEGFYDKYVMILKVIYSGFSFITEKLLGWAMLAVGFIIMLGSNAIRWLVSGGNVSAESVWRQTRQVQTNIRDMFSGDLIMTIAFSLLVKGVVIVAVLVLAIKLGQKVIEINKENNELSYTEIMEFIERDNKSTNLVVEMIKKIFRKKGSPREEVIYKYGEFVGLASKKGIFEKYMTPKQLLNVTKIKIDYCEGLDEISDIYNEAKFSLHVINKEKEQKVEKTVDNIKKSMK
ncbi:MAG: hypothetical protein RR891_03200 [Clostridium sp.]|uniref:hypothetical protein n=1 Tax=Clostridium sp. TaxID=1506 RepID=UPI0030235FA1